MNELTLFNSLPDKPEAIQRLENALLAMPQADIKTVHSFQPGKYERKIIIPPWTVLTGAPHKTDYWVRLEAGTIAVNTDDGIQVLTAPCEFQAKAGMKRAGRVFEQEVVWVDVYDNPDDCRDIQILEDRLYSIPECGLGENRRIERDKLDFKVFLFQVCMTENRMLEISQIASDLIPMPQQFHVELGSSPIHGTGLFATASFNDGELICAGRLDGHRTPAGRYTNHSCCPNAIPVKYGDDIYAYAVKQIQPGTEILIDYRASMRVNFGHVVGGELPCLDG